MIQTCRCLQRDFSDSSSPLKFSQHQDWEVSHTLLLEYLLKMQWIPVVPHTISNKHHTQTALGVSRFTLSGMIHIRLGSANASLGGNSTKDPLRKCCWEKEQGCGKRSFAKNESYTSLDSSGVTSLTLTSAEFLIPRPKASPLSSNSFTISFIISW